MKPSQQGVLPSNPRKGLVSKLTSEFRHFQTYPHGMRVLLITNLLYSLVLPVVEMFIGAYIMRNSSDSTLVVCFQLASYTGIPITFLINGFLLRRFRIATLYSFGMLLSGISMSIMMTLSDLDTTGVVVAGLVMGLSYGFFWSNRDFLALDSTNDDNRNYYYGLETFFYTITGVGVPYLIGAFIGATEHNGWFGGEVNMAYRIITIAVFLITILASFVIFRGKFQNPENKPFLFFRFERLWNKLLGLAALKGIAQGYIVTAPAMLIMTLVGNEATLGTVQSVGAILSAILLYILGRVSLPKDRLPILAVGLVLFALGGFFNAWFYSSVGVVIFMLCLVLSRPLIDIAYFPIQFRVIDIVSKSEQRSEFTYILSHEFGLYIGRLFGCGLFLILANFVSETFALRYALLIIGILQLLAYVIARNIDRECSRR
ncbi:MFS transporter [Alistipes megaguti]|uniref:MFS transporter n=1 Tax=Alistipes megaguti TaxID=2364787 RepID=UPI003B59C70E